jgi:hypothetical protein
VSFRRVAVLTAVLVALVCFLTWPQCLHLATRVASHDDGLFSPWRLAWIAHALRTDPARLYDANIFHPARGALANSDAVILQGALGSPFLWAGASPVAVYNVLLLAGIVTSGLAMFVLARHLIGNDYAALVAAAVFMMVPYRVEHFEHLELQWACFIPLTFWAVHRAFEGPSLRHGVLAGVLGWLQLIACVYYGVYLGLVAGALVVLLLLTTRIARERALTALAGLAAGGVVAACLGFVSLQPYFDNVTRVGVRETTEIGVHSAVAKSYLSAPVENWLWGWTSSMFEGDELHLFPGIVGSALAIAGLVFAPRRTALVYGVLLALAIELSFGLNGRLYPWLHYYLFPLQGLRATARASILAFAALALLAGFGARALLERWRDRLRAPALGLILLGALGIEYGSAPMLLQTAPETPAVYRLLRQLPRGPVAEFPMPKRVGGSAYDPLYMFSSASHWYPLVNGYSGFIPEHYLNTLDLMHDFPDEVSIDRLKQLGTRYVIVHEHGYTRDEYLAIITGLRARDDVVPFGRYADVSPPLHAELFELGRSAPLPSQ